MYTIEINWLEIENQNQLWETLSKQCGFPPWHGKNLDALNDSWVAGGIDKNGPPYDFKISNIKEIEEELSSFAEAVVEIAKESVEVNGGKINLS